MFRTLRVLFQRDPDRNRQSGNIFYEGYRLLWPDGKPVAVGVNAFCKHGQRLLGLGKYLTDGAGEKILDLMCFPIMDRNQDMTRLPGHRVRRFYLERHGGQGTIHFMDGTPTAAVFDLTRDEPQVLQWIGLSSLKDGEQVWLDLAARVAETPPAATSSPEVQKLPETHA